MSGLQAELDEARARVKILKRRIGFATCQEIGQHDWHSNAGCSAGCCKDCSCSVPVNYCRRCGDCDYGQNDDAVEVRKRCKAENGE